MQRYTVTGHSVNIHSGILDLAPEQAASRLHSLADLGDGLYEVLSPVQFKRGEEIGYDGEVNKALMQQIAPAVGEQKHKASPKQAAPPLVVASGPSGQQEEG